MVYDTFNELVIGAYKPTNITRGPIVGSTTNQTCHDLRNAIGSQISKTCQSDATGVKTFYSEGRPYKPVINCYWMLMDIHGVIHSINGVSTDL